MLRLQRNDVDERAVTLMLQGRIVAEWADLLERECLELIRTGARVELDLSEVVFIGRYGLEVLGRLSRAGAGITGYSPLIAAMLEQEGIVLDNRVDKSVRPQTSMPIGGSRCRKSK